MGRTDESDAADLAAVSSLRDAIVNLAVSETERPALAIVACIEALAAMSLVGVPTAGRAAIRAALLGQLGRSFDSYVSALEWEAN